MGLKTGPLAPSKSSGWVFVVFLVFAAQRRRKNRTRDKSTHMGGCLLFLFVFIAQRRRKNTT
jgi:hypothetical protein